MEDQRPSVVKKIRDACTDCGGHGFVLDSDNEMVECPCVLRAKVLGYLAPLGKLEDTSLKSTINKSLTKLDNFLIKVGRLSIAQLNGLLAELLMKVWSIDGYPPSFRVLDLNEVQDLWMGRQEDRLGNSLFRSLGCRILVLVWNGEAIPNRYMGEICGILVKGRISRGWITWVVCNSPKPLPNDFTDRDLESMGFKVFDWSGSAPKTSGEVSIATGSPRRSVPPRNKSVKNLIHGGKS